MRTKKCTKCGAVKSLSEFGKHSNSKDDHAWRCLECARKYARKRIRTPDGIYDALNSGRRHYQKNPKRILISRKEFNEWYDLQPQVCHYCDLPKKHLKSFMQAYGSRWFRFTIDCIDNEMGYALGNLVLACDKCNSVKSNILSHDEMKYVGKFFIKPKWQEYLGITSTVKAGKK